MNKQPNVGLQACCDGVWDIIVSYTGFQTGFRATSKRAHYIHDSLESLPPRRALERISESIVQRMCDNGSLETIVFEFEDHSNSNEGPTEKIPLRCFYSTAVARAVSRLLATATITLHTYEEDLHDGGRHLRTLYLLFSGYLGNMSDYASFHDHVRPHVYVNGLGWYTQTRYLRELVVKYFSKCAEEDVPESIPRSVRNWCS